MSVCISERGEFDAHTYPGRDATECDRCHASPRGRLVEVTRRQVAEQVAQECGRLADLGRRRYAYGGSQAERGRGWVAGLTRAADVAYQIGGES